jgi:putrescine aminotransferase
VASGKAGDVNDHATTGDTLLDADRRHLIHPLHHPKEHAQARIFVEGRGAMLRTADGKEYIDGLSALWNVNIGHGRKELADTAAAQMAKLAYASAYTGFSNEPAIRLAERIVDLCYDNMAAAYFTTGGAESNESAFKIARYYWKRMGKPNKVKIISRQYGYHGVTLAAMSANSLPGYHKMFGPLVPEFLQVAPPYPYRWPGNGDCGIEAADAVEAAIESHGADTIAAVIAEPVMGAGGVIVPPPTYFPRLRQICDRHDVLLIADEVITGFGRTGRWFALQHWNVQADLMIFAKGITSGYLPLSGVMLTRQVHDTLKSVKGPFQHGFTYSGHPTACAVGLRNLQIIEDERLVERVVEVGPYLQEQLRKLRSHDIVGDVRGLGLMAAVEFVRDRQSKEQFDLSLGVARRVWTAALEMGVIVRPLPGDVIALSPPFVISEREIDRVVAVLDQVITTVARELRAQV